MFISLQEGGRARDIIDIMDITEVKASEGSCPRPTPFSHPVCRNLEGALTMNDASCSHLISRDMSRATDPGRSEKKGFESRERSRGDSI